MSLENFSNWDEITAIHPCDSQLDLNLINYNENLDYSDLKTYDLLNGAKTSSLECDEPPLLDELEIYPARILEKVAFVLNPLHRKRIVDSPNYFFEETDMAGPMVFWLIFAACLFISGAKAHFGYVYTLTLIAISFMYLLVKLMCFETNNFVSLLQIASILGYSSSPVMFVAILRITLQLHSPIGYGMCGICILWASASCSRLLCMMMGDTNQTLILLLLYPSALIYASYLLLVLF